MVVQKPRFFRDVLQKRSYFEGSIVVIATCVFCSVVCVLGTKECDGNFAGLHAFIWKNYTSYILLQLSTHIYLYDASLWYVLVFLSIKYIVKKLKYVFFRCDWRAQRRFSDGPSCSTDFSALCPSVSLFPLSLTGHCCTEHVITYY